MRLGVSARIFLAYAVLLVAFAGLSVFTLENLHRSRQELAANQQRLEVQLAVDAGWRALVSYSQARAEAQGAPAQLTSRVAATGGLSFARQALKEALSAIRAYLVSAPSSPRREEFENCARQIASLEAQMVEVAIGLGALADPGAHPRNSGPGERSLTRLVSAFERLKEEIRGRGTVIAAELSLAEARAVRLALVVGGLGLLAAIGAALFMLHTLRPLGILRLHARQIAGGEYARRIGLRSRDEIGDLSREFDAMAGALEEREGRLIRSERLATVGRMAAQITHEIRNPLASIGLYVELLGDELGAQDGEARRLLGAIGTEVDRLSEITETYLRFVRLPRPKLDREDLGALATAVLEFARAELSAAGISLELSVAAGLPEVGADENQIRQALLNLVRNAREAMPEGGKLRVEVSASPPAHVGLAVADTGPGIAPENLEKIFDPFFSTKDGGTGLGLALVQQIVAEHGGRIEAARGPDGGSVFSIRLPALPPETAGSRPADRGREQPAAPTAKVEPDPQPWKLH